MFFGFLVIQYWRGKLPMKPSPPDVLVKSIPLVPDVQYFFR
jgi:hypothetical protein